MTHDTVCVGCNRIVPRHETTGGYCRKCKPTETETCRVAHCDQPAFGDTGVCRWESCEAEQRNVDGDKFGTK